MVAGSRYCSASFKVVHGLHGRGKALTQAPLPPRLIAHFWPGPSLLVYVLVNKYADHLSLYFPCQIFDWDGRTLGPSALTSWVGQLTALVDVIGEMRWVLSVGCRAIVKRGRRQSGGGADMGLWL
ncbi:MAG: transposase [Paracoccaceae bacterium]|jgi:transposase